MHESSPLPYVVAISLPLVQISFSNLLSKGGFGSNFEGLKWNLAIYLLNKSDKYKSSCRMFRCFLVT